MDALATYPQAKMGATAAAPAPAYETAVKRVLDALNNQKYTWRTLDGIANDTGLQVAQVEEILKTALSDQVIRAAARDDQGRSLFTARARYKESRGLLGRLMTALSDQVR